MQDWNQQEAGLFLTKLSLKNDALNYGVTQMFH